MNYQSSDIQQNIFQMNGGGVQSGIPFNSFVHDQMKVLDGDRVIVPKQHERFQNLMIPTGLAINCSHDSSMQKGGALLIKELDVNTVNTQMFDSMLDNICLKKKRNKSEKSKVGGKNTTKKLFFF
tara:strand:- start:509 stop:883 length:375 start_codon:yes stop_codon:yes gene_type:complete